MARGMKKPRRGKRLFVFEEPWAEGWNVVKKVPPDTIVEFLNSLTRSLRIPMVHIHLIPVGIDGTVSVVFYCHPKERS